MAIFTTDIKPELNQIKEAAKNLLDESINPMIKGAINQASEEINKAVEKAGQQIQTNINLLSTEIHDQRQLTRDDLIALVDYAAEKIGTTIDQRLLAVKLEATSFVTERVEHLKKELEDAAIKSRRTLYMNLAISMGSALAMAIIGIVYKKISIGELDLFAVFRVLLLSAATGTIMFAGLKSFHNWLALNKAKKNAATVVINHISVFRPNGAIGLFVVSILLLAGWFLASFY
jgi:hypothetical protein